MAVTIQIVGLDAAEVWITTTLAEARPRATAVVRHFGQLYQTRVKARASGRPGPRVITGDYRRSIYFELTTVGASPAAIVGTNAPQGRRLEYGFVGVDSLGRHFNQPPYPHFEPPLEATLTEMHVALLELAR